MSTRFAMTPASFTANHAATGLRDIARWVTHIQAAHVSRRELAELEPRLLEDIGITGRQALVEARRAPWDMTPPVAYRRGGGNGGQAGGGRAGGRQAGSAFTAMRTGLRAAMRRWRTRQRISELDQHALRDIGVTYAEAEREANKTFWQR